MKTVYILQHKVSLIILGCCATRKMAEFMINGGVDANVQIVECDVMHE